MEFLNRTFLFLHIRAHNRKIFKLCLRKWILIIFVGLGFIQLIEMFYYATKLSLIPSQIIDLISVFILFILCLCLGYYWIKVWKKADYHISLAIHGNPKDKN